MAGDHYFGSFVDHRFSTYRLVAVESRKSVAPSCRFDHGLTGGVAACRHRRHAAMAEQKHGVWRWFLVGLAQRLKPSEISLDAGDQSGARGLVPAGLGDRPYFGGQSFETGTLLNAYDFDTNGFQLGQYFSWAGRGGDNQPFRRQREDAFGCQVA